MQDLINDIDKNLIISLISFFSSRSFWNINFAVLGLNFYRINGVLSPVSFTRFPPSHRQNLFIQLVSSYINFLALVTKQKSKFQKISAVPISYFLSKPIYTSFFQYCCHSFFYVTKKKILVENNYFVPISHFVLSKYIPFFSIISNLNYSFLFIFAERYCKLQN